VLLWGQRTDDGSIAVDQAQLRRTTGGTDFVEELGVRRGVVLVLFGNIVFIEDRLDGAHGLARTTIDALVGVNVEHPLALVDAVNGAFLDAGLVL